MRSTVLVEASASSARINMRWSCYRAINRWPDGRRLYDLTRALILTVVPITAEILDGARSLLDAYPQLMARDALHASVCHEVGARGICSYDTDFDVVRGLKRIEPQHV